jgi:hypothetical protein
VPRGTRGTAAVATDQADLKGAPSQFATDLTDRIRKIRGAVSVLEPSSIPSHFGSGDIVFTFRQDGNTITGEVEAAGGGFGGGAAGGVIEDGKISFRAGTATYVGTVNGELIEPRRNAPPRRGGSGRLRPVFWGSRWPRPGARAPAASARNTLTGGST